MAPANSAVPAVITSVKLPADGVPVAATDVGAIAAAGVGETGKIPAIGLTGEVLALLGAAVAYAVVGVTAPGATTGTVAGDVDDGGALAGEVLAGRVLAGGVLAAAGALTATASAADGSTLMAGLVVASAVAVRVTDVTEAPAATGIWACIWYVDGASEVASAPIVQVAAPSPLGQRDVKSGAKPEGDPVSVTVTPDADPFAAQTCTVYDAA